MLKQQEEKKKQEEEIQAVEAAVNNLTGNMSVALSAGATHHSQARDHFYNTVTGVLSQVAVFLEDSTLDDKTRMIIQQERSQIRILELRAKRRHLETQNADKTHDNLVVESHGGEATDHGAASSVLTQYSL